jgi:hypothetical protein
MPQPTACVATAPAGAAAWIASRIVSPLRDRSPPENGRPWQLRCGLGDDLLDRLYDLDLRRMVKDAALAAETMGVRSDHGDRPDAGIERRDRILVLQEHEGLLGEATCKLAVRDRCDEPLGRRRVDVRIFEETEAEPGRQHTTDRGVQQRLQYRVRFDRLAKCVAEAHNRRKLDVHARLERDPPRLSPVRGNRMPLAGLLDSRVVRHGVAPEAETVAKQLRQDLPGDRGQTVEIAEAVHDRREIRFSDRRLERERHLLVELSSKGVGLLSADGHVMSSF